MLPSRAADAPPSGVAVAGVSFGSTSGGYWFDVAACGVAARDNDQAAAAALGGQVRGSFGSIRASVAAS